MSGEFKNDVGESDTEIKRTSKKNKGVMSRLWGAMFRTRGDDFEKRLQYISDEEAAVLTRISRRSQSWGRMTRQLIVFSVLLEVISVGYAIMTTRSLDLEWKMRALRVLPMFLLPALSSITYSLLGRYIRMCDQKDHQTLENLRAERQERINELKEKSNYYITQQLIQKYDPDPAAKAAAATVLASKLGADSGLKLYMADESDHSVVAGKSSDMEIATTTGLRNRKRPLSMTSSIESGGSPYHPDEMLSQVGFESADMFQQGQSVVEHHPQTAANATDGGWIARLAALLVGEDPTQSYALICRKCHMHNGLARKEELPYITYYCPHCKALNRPTQPCERTSESNSPTANTSLTMVEDAEVVQTTGERSPVDTISEASPVAVAGISET